MADRGYGTFTTAIVREIPGSLAGEQDPPAEGEEREDTVDLQKARDEWTTYVDTLRTLGLRVITIPADEECPGCACVADTAVVVDGIAFVTRPTNPDRRKELKAVKEVLEEQLGAGNVAELRDIEATLDGRDVLFTGREFFVRVTESNNNAPQSPTRRLPTLSTDVDRLPHTHCELVVIILTLPQFLMHVSMGKSSRTKRLTCMWRWLLVQV